jgi:adenylate cyclase
MPLLSEPVAGLASKQVLLRFSRPTESGDERWIVPTYSFFDVLLSADRVASGQTPPIPPSAFAGKLVFVGTSAAGMYDRYSTPFDGGASGVELHATLADNVLTGTFMSRATPLTDSAYALGAGLVVALSATLLPVALAIPAAGAVVGAVALGLSRAVGSGTWIALVPAGTAAGLSLVGGIAWRYFVEDRSKRQIRHLFGRYVSNDVIHELLTNPALASLGGERREMTVLFSDIRGFTSASEAGRPEDVVRQLNEYFGAMVEVLFRHQGTLDKFVGDMVMGLFGAPVPDDRHADHAVAAALDMVEALGRLNQKWAAEGRPSLDIGIGINSGEMIAGNIGSEAIMSYTVIGDAVNLGARLESLNKEFGTRILMSDATRVRLTHPVACRPLGSVTVKGKTQPVEIHEVLTTKEHAQ